MIEHAVKFPERDQAESADQQPKQNFEPGKRDEERDRPKSDCAEEAQNEHRARPRRFGRRFLKRRGHGLSSSQPERFCPQITQSFADYRS